MMITRTSLTVSHFRRMFTTRTPRTPLLLVPILLVTLSMAGCRTKPSAEQVEADTTQAPMKPEKISPSSIPAAVVLVGPRVSIYAVSAKYEVSGASAVGGGGYDIAGNPDAECPGKAGIAIEAVGLSGAAGPVHNDFDITLNTAADLAACEHPIPPAAYHNVCISLSRLASRGIRGNTSSGGTMVRPNPDITVNDPTFTAADAAKLYEDVITNGTPDQTLPGPATSGDITHWGTLEDPVVIHATGDLSTPGNHTGYGILVVDGNLMISGRFTWNGIVLVGACPTCAGKLTGVGNLNLAGTAIIGNEDPNLRSRLDFMGMAAIHYSCEGIDIANGAY